MKLIKRHIASVVEKAGRTFPVTIVSGPRQVGKTTLLQHQHPSAAYVTFDRLDVLESARTDPERFLSALARPAIIDEVQYCPDLFRYIKMDADAHRGQKGRLFLTGSQRFHMMEGVDESLAGRAGIVEMLGLSLREILSDPFSEPFIPTATFLEARKPKPLRSSVWTLIHRGDLPELTVDPAMDPATYYASYVDTYLRRDVRDLSHVGNLAAFDRFLRITATYHGQVLNKSALASDCGISFATADRWLSVLQASSIIYLLRPFTASSKKRLVKSPKLYFLNSGVAASLCGLESAEAIAQSRQAGAFFEGFVIAEVVKSFLNASGRFPELYYYRDSNGKEIDLVIERDRALYPVEIKAAELARPSDVKAFAALDGFSGYERQPGVVVCNMPAQGSADRTGNTGNTGGTSLLPLPDGSSAIPVTYL